MGEPSVVAVRFGPLCIPRMEKIAIHALFFSDQCVIYITTLSALTQDAEEGRWASLPHTPRLPQSTAHMREFAPHTRQSTTYDIQHSCTIRACAPVGTTKRKHSDTSPCL